MAKDNIESLIEDVRPSLSAEERSAVLRAVEERVTPAGSVSSPYFSIIFSRAMPTLIITLILALGATGTVAASNAAKPGDLLFPLERATERVQLALASEEHALELRSQFAEERLAELQEIIDEEASVVTQATDEQDSGTTPTTTVETFFAEAVVFTDLTAIRVEFNDQVFRFVTDVATRESVATFISERLEVDPEVVDAGLMFETEDRNSRPSERGLVTVSDEGEERISRAVNEFLDNIEDFTDEDERLALLTAFLSEIDNVAVEGRSAEKVRVRNDENRVRIKDDRVEIEDDGYKVKIDKEGEVKVRTENTIRHNTGSFYSDQLRNQDRDSQDSIVEAISGLIKFTAEADVFTDTTVIKVEINGIENIFESDAGTKDEVIDEIVSIYGLERAAVADVLDFQVENRASKPADLGIDEPVPTPSFDDDDDEWEDEHEEDEEWEEEDEHEEEDEEEEEHRERDHDDDDEHEEDDD